MTCVSRNSVRAHSKRALGFTIVELVVVLLLLGILSATALSRFVEPSAFAPRTIAGALMAQTHFAALSAQTSADDVDFVVLPSAGDWTMDVSIMGLSQRSTTAAMANTRIEVRIERAIPGECSETFAIEHVTRQEIARILHQK